MRNFTRTNTTTTSGSNSLSTRLRRRRAPAPLTYLAALALALTVPARAQTFTDADWVSLNSLPGANGWVRAIAVDGSGKVYVGGAFTLFGTVQANNIAKWDGSTWSPLGGGLTDNPNTSPSVNALTMVGTNLYAAGRFTVAGGQPAASVAKWDGRAWSALGSGIPWSDFYNYQAYVTALAVSGDNLYVGGCFTNAGGVAVTNIAQWNGRAWSALGSGINGIVYALAVSGTNLYAGGTFTTAGGVPTNCIAKWDGRTWSALGSGINGDVSALALNGTDLYAGGSFTTAGGVMATNVAKWDGSAWSALGSGITGDNPYVYALAVSGTNLYAGGAFTTAGGVPVNCIAKWDGSAWSALGSGMGISYPYAPDVTALAADGAGHLFVGGDFTLAGTNVSPYIAQANLGSAPTSGPPVIVASPASLAAAVGATADFQVAATGSPPLVYQWVFNGTNAIAGATSSVLSLTNLQLTQAGAYSVTVSNLYGAVTSAPALLQVLPPGIVVTNSEAALRSAMAGGGTVTFVCDGTITLNNTVVIGTDTVLDGSGRQVTLSGGNRVRVFTVNSNITLTLLDLTIAYGLSTNGYGGGISNVGTLNATNCRFVTNTIRGEPNVYPGLPAQDACGGAVYNSGSLNLMGCSFLSNSACGGQGANFAGVNGSGGDGGGSCGGAICNLGNMVIQRSLFASNTAVGGAGGEGESGNYFIFDQGPEYFAEGGGSGGNSRGGALFVGGPSSLVNCTLTGNQAVGGSGGAGGNGGEGVNMGNGHVTYYPGAGGGSGGTACGVVFDVTGALRLTNCTIAFNSSVGGAGSAGGAGNPMGSTGGSGVAAGAVQTTNGVLANCLLDGNLPTNSTGSIADAGHNLSSDASCAFTNLGSLNNTDPRLGPLQDNGGPTLTMALLPGSPAIDAGDTALASATDQRGFPRPAGLASDIGAFEYGSVMPAIAVSRAGATGLNILGSGNAGQSCRLLSSTDLSSWVPVATNCIGSDGTILFHDNCAPGGACRFYLLVMP